MYIKCPILWLVTVCTYPFSQTAVLTCAALASSSESNTRAIFVLAGHKPPYNVYGAPFYNYAGYGNVFSVDPSDGRLLKNVQNYEYHENTGIHGMVFDPTETYLYSADLQANKIWTHRKDAQTGELTLVDCLEAPSPDDHPRWVDIHPSGKYLYALMEAGNRLAVYVIDEKRGVPVFTHITYPLLPAGKLSMTRSVQVRSILTMIRRPSNEQIPRRRLLHHAQRPVPVCNHARNLRPSLDRVYHGLQAGS